MTTSFEVGIAQKFIVEVGLSNKVSILDMSKTHICFGKLNMSKKEIRFSIDELKKLSEFRKVNLPSNSAFQVRQEEIDMIKIDRKQEEINIVNQVVNGEILLTMYRNEDIDGYFTGWSVGINKDIGELYEEDLWEKIKEKMGYGSRLANFDKMICKRIENPENRKQFKLLDVISYANSQEEIIREKKTNEALDSIESNYHSKDSGLSNYGVDFESLLNVDLIKDSTKSNEVFENLKESYNEGRF